MSKAKWNNIDKKSHEVRGALEGLKEGKERQAGVDTILRYVILKIIIITIP